MPTIEELEAKLFEVNAKRDDLATQARALAKELSGMKELEMMERRVADLTTDQKIALAQTLQAHGIPGAEAFGKI